ncbi:ABC transporter ATP-binding protein [Deinococcus geothermalis]|uniref:ABC transporter ATP-binding protein n=1 Tax=Deinococcus geothermalis TaxID=68909 RepID=UPI0002FB6AE6|nr:ATP-binding cassette domain-containing protein [Deinococcus geothermalis]
MTLLEASGLTRWVGDRELWRGWSCAVTAGESVAVVGPSGSGKSVLLRTLAGLEVVEAGEVRFQGKPQGAWPMSEYRAHVLYLPQRPAFDEGRVLDVLRAPFGFRVHQQRRFEQAAAGRLLASLGRDEALLSRDAATLSGGEGQITALVRALLLGPSVLLLDEATSALDPETVALAETLLGHWCVETPGRALIWVSHDPAQRRRVAQRELPLVPAVVA